VFSNRKCFSELSELNIDVILHPRYPPSQGQESPPPCQSLGLVVQKPGFLTLYINQRKTSFKAIFPTAGLTHGNFFFRNLVWINTSFILILKF
jgi:hypothetical protein